MSGRRARTSGWAAFDLNERRKQQGLQPEYEKEAFPPISVPVASPGGPSHRFVKGNGMVLEKPFSSVLLPSVKFPSLMANKGSDANQSQAGDSSLSQSSGFAKERCFVEVHQQLKELHPWADDTLIKDVMAGVNNDLTRALIVLEAMGNPDQTYDDHDSMKTKEPRISLTSKEADAPCIENFKEEDTETKRLNLNTEDYLQDSSKLPGNKGMLCTDGMNLEELGHVLDKCLDNDDKEIKNNYASSVDKFHIDKMVGSMNFVPVEPEWQEDDVYTIHRRDAMKVMRSAARHSKAATEAYLRGDHLYAQYFSLKAREEWISANKINAMAAREILCIRNRKNDEWTLDLHGLHAAEAVQALQEHLQKIESQLSQNRAARVNEVNMKANFGVASSLESSGHIDVESEVKRSLLNKHRPTSLQVITGKGTHSRGEAALPMAVRSFLIENGYRYEETRPGVITVKPKFRLL